MSGGCAVRACGSGATIAEKRRLARGVLALENPGSRRSGERTGVRVAEPWLGPRLTPDTPWSAHVSESGREKLTVGGHQHPWTVTLTRPHLGHGEAR